MVPDSDLLVLTICSFTKKPGGSSEYDPDDAVPRRLGDLGHTLLRQRRRMREWVVDTADLRWGGQRLAEMELNAGLALGRDFGQTGNAQYLPAIDRYQGRFYAALSVDGRGRVRASRHHYLIVSGLYGLVAPLEPIQCYSCPIDPWSYAFHQWRTGGRTTLTDLLVAYVRSAGVVRVLDLMANETYRNLIDWPALCTHLPGSGDAVLHAYSSQAAGDGALSIFGSLVGDPEFDTRAHRFWETRRVPFGGFELAFQSELGAPEDWPVDYTLRWTREDAVGRMRRGAVRFMNRRDQPKPGHDHGREGFARRADRLCKEKRIADEERLKLKYVGRARNTLDYEAKPLRSQELQRLREAYEYLRACEPDIPEFGPDWDTLMDQLDWAYT